MYTDPEVARGRAGADLRAHLAAGRPRRLAAASPAATSPRAAGTQPVLVVRDENGQLRAYRNVCRHRGSRLLSGDGQCKGGDPLPLPRLDLPVRRHADRRPRGPRVRRAPGQVDARAAAGRASRSCAGWCSSTSTPTPTPLADLVGDLPQRLERYRIPTLESFAPGDGDAAGQLEGGRRQLPRGLPHPDRPPGADADARLQALRRRGARALRVVRGAAARQAEQQPARAPVRRSS